MVEIKVDESQLQSHVDKLFGFDGNFKYDQVGAVVRAKAIEYVRNSISTLTPDRQIQVLENAAKIEAPWDGWVERGKIPLPHPAGPNENQVFPRKREEYFSAVWKLDSMLTGPDGTFDAEAFKIWAAARGFSTVDPESPAEFQKLVNLGYIMDKLHPEIAGPNHEDFLESVDTIARLSIMNLHMGGITPDVQDAVKQAGEKKLADFKRMYRDGTVTGDTPPATMGAWGLSEEVNGMIRDIQYQQDMRSAERMRKAA